MKDSRTFLLKLAFSPLKQPEESKIEGNAYLGNVHMFTSGNNAQKLMPYWPHMTSHDHVATSRDTLYLADIWILQYVPDSQVMTPMSHTHSDS